MTVIRFVCVNLCAFASLRMRVAPLIAAIAFCTSILSGQTALSATLSASVPSPAPVGTIVTWTASGSGSSAGNVRYRFRVRDLADIPRSCHGAQGARIPQDCASVFSVIRDYGPVATLDWTASEHEGDYEIEVSARDNDSGAISIATSAFRFSSRLTDATPVISSTANPLVFLYSAPACPAGSTMRVEFQAPDGSLQSTNSKSCDGRRSMNFYLAGMQAQTVYSVQHVVQGGAQVQAGSIVLQRTPEASLDFAARTVAIAPPAGTPNTVILQARFGWPAATDALGNLLWYSVQDLSMISRPEPGGLFLGWFESETLDAAHQILREFDLAGTVLRETNAARVSEQLTAMGMHAITCFHHEVRGLPDGGILALAATERILTDVQGPGPVDVIGDTIVVLDRNLQVQWAWDTFDHLDPYRMATLKETC
ncbi:MAG TPA: aryl-sulfate sulfotransferase, partial [Bryobacteraceae bacterium]